MASLTPDETKKRLLEINETISKLDPSIRAAAFDILAPSYFEGLERTPRLDKPRPADDADVGATPVARRQPPVVPTDRGEFYQRFDHTDPADNVLLIAAWLYSQYGVYPMTRKAIEEEASDAGLTIPNRSDMTMRAAKREGKNLFRQQGKGWQVTVSGEAELRKTYSVRKGTQPAPTEKGDE